MSQLRDGYSSKKIVKRAFDEVKKNVPRAVRSTARKKGKAMARKQTIAIALSKARTKGAAIRPNPNRGT